MLRTGGDRKGNLTEYGPLRSNSTRLAGSGFKLHRRPVSARATLRQLTACSHSRKKYGGRTALFLPAPRAIRDPSVDLRWLMPLFGLNETDKFLHFALQPSKRAVIVARIQGRAIPGDD